MLAVAVRLTLKLSFAEAHSTLGLFLPSPPSPEVIEQSVLGLGRHTSAWFESAPAPFGDGDALVIQIDNKGAPMATDSELAPSVPTCVRQFIPPRITVEGEMVGWHAQG